MFCICSLSHLFGIVSCTVSNEGRVGRDKYNDSIHIMCNLKIEKQKINSLSCEKKTLMFSSLMVSSWPLSYPVIEEI